MQYFMQMDISLDPKFKLELAIVEGLQLWLKNVLSWNLYIWKVLRLQPKLSDKRVYEKSKIKKTNFSC